MADWIFQPNLTAVTDGPPPNDFTSGTNSQITIAFAVNVPGGLSRIFLEFAALSKSGRAHVIEFSGVAHEQPVDRSIHGGNVTGTTQTQTTLTTANANDLVVCAISGTTASSVVPVLNAAGCSPTTGWNTPVGGAVSASQAYRQAWQAFASTGTYGCSWTIGASGNVGMIGLALEAAPGQTPAFVRSTEGATTSNERITTLSVIPPAAGNCLVIVYTQAAAATSINFTRISDNAPSVAVGIPWIPGMMDQLGIAPFYGVAPPEIPAVDLGAETPPPGGAVAAGFEPVVFVPVTAGSAAAAGVAPAESTATTETPTPGGATAGGFAPVARVAVPVGGAAAAGPAPAPRVAAPAGGAVGQGSSPVAAASVSAGGAVAVGFAPGPRISITLAGAVAVGFGPTAAASLTIAGATAGGFGATVRVATTIAGAIAKGYAPSESTPTSDTPVPGGATAGGFGPTARATVSAGGATAGGYAPAESAASSDTPGRGGATAGGFPPAPVVAVAIVGATGQGFAPTTRTSVTLGGAGAGGFGPVARVTFTIGGAVAGGRAPAESTSTVETPGRGGAVAGGPSPTVRVVTPVGGATGAGIAPAIAATPALAGALASGRTATVRVAVGIGGATAGGQLVDPLQVFITTLFGSSSPNGGAGVGTPAAASYGPGSPNGGAGVAGSPAANGFGPPSPGKVRV